MRIISTALKTFVVNLCTLEYQYYPILLIRSYPPGSTIRHQRFARMVHIGHLSTVLLDLSEESGSILVVTFTGAPFVVPDLSTQFLGIAGALTSPSSCVIICLPLLPLNHCHPHPNISRFSYSSCSCSPVLPHHGPSPILSQRQSSRGCSTPIWNCPQKSQL